MTRPPRFLLGLGLALWGSCADVLVIGLLLGALVEVLRVLNPRLRFGTAEFNRVADLGTLLSLGAIGYFAATLGLSQGMLRAVVWLPVTTFPVLLAQIVSEAGHLRLRNLSYSLRKSELPEADRPVDIAYSYFALCLVAASLAGREYATMFYSVAGLLAAYGLFAVRGRGRAVWAWAAALVVALTLGMATAAGMYRLQVALEDMAFAWLSSAHPDPYRATTRIGDVGHVKLSDTIVWRVRARRSSGELLLFEAAYTDFDGSSWRAPPERFASLGLPQEWRTWNLGSTASASDRIEISGYTTDGGALLAIPPAPGTVSNLEANEVLRNALGSVKVADASPYLRFEVSYAPGAIAQPPPTRADTHVPAKIRPLLAEVGSELAPARNAAEAVRAVQRFFAERFRYSLYLGDRPGGKSLESFLRESRAGHCEYFATATTLLLRSLGVPARYVVGYSVQEFSPLEGLYVVRGRHAHAWTEAYVDGAWVYVDTTPAIWVEAEADAASALTPLYDRVSWLWALFSEWRTRGDQHTGGWLLGGALLLTAWIYWRVFRRRPRAKAAGETQRPQRAASDSAYYQAEAELARAGYGRRIGETPFAWLGRLASDRCPYLSDALVALVEAHYRCAYQPDADRRELEAEMRELAARWRTETSGRARAA